jgi:hypothetical protein
MTIADALPITGFAFIPWADRALSEEAQVLRRRFDEASEFSGSVTVGELRRTAQEAIDVAYEAAQVDNWNGEGSARVEPSTYIYACQFLMLLPSTIPLPEITADTDGEILFEWDLGPRRVFSISVGRDGTLTFAGLFGYRKIHGTEHSCEALPVVISECFERLLFPSRH